MSSQDEQYAIDLQLAMDLQAQEEQRQRRNQTTREERQKSRDDWAREGGFVANNIKPDRMLFVHCEIDGKLVEMLVDSGASSSAMTQGYVELLGLSHKLNRDIIGNAGGVGSANIEGVVENVLCMIGHVEFRLYFLVLDSRMPSCILGLDQMRRFKCIIDLEKDVLKFGGSSGLEVSFLPPELAKDAAERMTGGGTHIAPPPSLSLTASSPARTPVPPSASNDGSNDNLARGFGRLFGRRR